MLTGDGSINEERSKRREEEMNMRKVDGHGPCSFLPALRIQN